MQGRAMRGSRYADLGGEGRWSEVDAVRRQFCFAEFWNGGWTMKRLAILTWCAAAALISERAFAAVTPQEADKLGKELTAFGAGKAGNADGTIPAYESADPPPPGAERGNVAR